MRSLSQMAARYRQIQRHRAGEVCSVRSPSGTRRRLYLSSWAVLSGPELRRQAKKPDHTVQWMSLEEMLAYCAPYEVISFDVFDTLLCRGCGEPQHIFALLEKQNGIPDFASARQTAERDARRELGEVTLTDIYRRLEETGTIPPGQAEAGMAAEWALEKSLMLAHPRMQALFRALRAQGKRIIAISDMYLSAARIAELLSAVGYPLPETIFVSCEQGVGKAGGALFRKVREQIGAGSVLHIGDNAEADGACAELAGWDTALLMNPAQLAWESGSVLPYGGDMIASALRRQLRYGGGAVSDSPVYEIGYSVTGPLTVGFCQWIRQMQIRQGWEKLFFSARDGFLMHRIYTAYFGDAEYMPVSRAAVQMLDLEKQAQSYCDNNLLVHLELGEQVEEVLGGLFLGGMLTAWREEGLDPAAPFDGKTEALVRRLIIRDREKIAAAFTPARENALRWFRQRLQGVSRAVVIDTGWKGSAGATLRDFIRQNGIPAVVDTALMGTSRAVSVAVREERGELFSWLYSPTHDRDRLARQFEGENALACALMEMLFMTDQPQLLSYAGKDFTYAPAEHRYEQMVNDLHAGALDFARDYHQLVRSAGLETQIPAAAAYRFFEELLLEKQRLLRAFGDYVFNAAPTPEGTEITFADRMKKAGWIR